MLPTALGPPPPHLLNQLGCRWSPALGSTVLGPTAVGCLLGRRHRAGPPPLLRQGRLGAGTLFQVQTAETPMGMLEPLGSGETSALPREPQPRPTEREGPRRPTLSVINGQIMVAPPPLYRVSSQASAPLPGKGQEMLGIWGFLSGSAVLLAFPHRICCGVLWGKTDQEQEGLLTPARAPESGELCSARRPDPESSLRALGLWRVSCVCVCVGGTHAKIQPSPGWVGPSVVPLLLYLPWSLSLWV